ncbi:MAG: aspartate--ammonia ligase [Clostridiales bacterium]|nr:MAG: aspartate--ammonia ligase [Clostridiales bacterium]
MPYSVLPKDYKAKLNLLETEIAIKKVKDFFEDKLAEVLSLTRVSAPLFVMPETGLNDNLNGVERPVGFDILQTSEVLEVVHSLAKWKRLALYRYQIPNGKGIYTDMNAIRRDETMDNIHSIYVDQWDWEKVISRQERTEDNLKNIVTSIYRVFQALDAYIVAMYPTLEKKLPEEIHFVTSQELEDLYPNLSAKEREHEIAKKYKAVFIMQIGDELNSGGIHDGRAPDYDDWSLNGDIIFYNPVLDIAFEMSSMGIRVDEESLKYQLNKSKTTNKMNMKYHKMVLNGELPLTVGGGIGQSRMCMYFLEKAHIGEVQSSYWPEETVKLFRSNNIELL